MTDNDEEILGICERCRTDVTYRPDRADDDPADPAYTFDIEAEEDVVWHWGCLHGNAPS